MANKREMTPEVVRRSEMMLLALIPSVLMAGYLYGVRAVLLTLLAAVCAFLSDLLVRTVRKKTKDRLDAVSVFYAITFTLLLPASARYETVVFGTMMAMLMRHAFGGRVGNVFQPAAFGFACCVICWPSLIFRYPRPFARLGLLLSSGARLYDTPAHIFRRGGMPTVDWIDLLVGNYPGPMGTTFSLLLLSVLVFLLVKRVLTWHIPLIYMATVVAVSFVLPMNAGNRWLSVMMVLIAGAEMFVAIFLVADPGTAPVNPAAKLVYAVLVGAIGALFLRFGAFQMGAVFAVLLCNPLAGLLDRKLTPKRYELKETIG